MKGAEADWTELFALDLRGLSYLRIALGSLVILHMMSACLGVLSASPESTTSIGASLSLLGSEIDFWRFVAAVFALPLLLGYRTRLAVIATWFAWLQYVTSLPVGSWGVMILLVLLFFSIFLPLGTKWSLDAKRIGDGSHTSSPRYCSLGTFAFLTQLALIYLSAGVTKSIGIWVIEARALEGVLSNSMLVSPVGEALLNFPTLLAVLSIGTFFLEIWGPLFLFYPRHVPVIRTVISALFISLHVGIAIAMDIGLFPYVCILAWISVLPTEVWDFFESRKLSFLRKRSEKPIIVGRSFAEEFVVGPAILFVVLLNIFFIFPGILGAETTHQLRYWGSKIGLSQGWVMFNNPRWFTDP